MGDLPTSNKGGEIQEDNNINIDTEADHEYEVMDRFSAHEGEAEQRIRPPKLESVQLELQLVLSAGDYDCPAAVIPEATTCINEMPAPVTSLQKNEAYGLVLENTQTAPSIVECTTNEPITPQRATSDLHVHITDSTSKGKHPSIITIISDDLCITAENINSCDGKSDSEHLQLCSYEKVQHCDVDHYLKVSHQQEPSLHSVGTIVSDGKMETTAADSSPTIANESLDSYEQVCSYERVYHCDLPLEECLEPKN